MAPVIYHGQSLGRLLRALGVTPRTPMQLVTPARVINWRERMWFDPRPSQALVLALRASPPKIMPRLEFKK
jgi:hypothetical protein